MTVQCNKHVKSFCSCIDWLRWDVDRVLRFATWVSDIPGASIGMCIRIMTSIINLTISSSIFPATQMNDEMGWAFCHFVTRTISQLISLGKSHRRTFEYFGMRAGAGNFSANLTLWCVKWRGVPRRGWVVEVTPSLPPLFYNQLIVSQRVTYCKKFLDADERRKRQKAQCDQRYSLASCGTQPEVVAVLMNECEWQKPLTNVFKYRAEDEKKR